MSGPGRRGSVTTPPTRPTSARRPGPSVGRRPPPPLTVVRRTAGERWSRSRPTTPTCGRASYLPSGGCGSTASTMRGAPRGSTPPSVDRPGAANRAFENLHTMPRTARQCGELPEDAPDHCANFVMKPRRPVVRYLAREELERLGAVFYTRRAEHPWPVARALCPHSHRRSALGGAQPPVGRGRRVVRGRCERPAPQTPRPGPRTLWLGPQAVTALGHEQTPKKQSHQIGTEVPSRRQHRRSDSSCLT